ncbi:MAG TPA: Smr/MutS family protein [Sphingomicrobium sp.]|nr:Smr/MutS family protein [Sphingomicrobium sp.]
MRGLSPDEQALWAKVTETIRPLSRDPLPKAPNIASPMRPAPPPIAHKVKGPAPNAPRMPARARPAIGNTLDSSWDRKLRSGNVQPDRVVDLHGHNLDRAWQAIDRALEQAIVDQERVILLVTGHARAGEPPVPRGRIRAAVHDWLAASRHREKIAAVRGAHRRHGGGGSLYLILRR